MEPRTPFHSPIHQVGTNQLQLWLISTHHSFQKHSNGKMLPGATEPSAYSWRCTNSLKPPQLPMATMQIPSKPCTDYLDLALVAGEGQHKPRPIETRQMPYDEMHAAQSLCLRCDSWLSCRRGIASLYKAEGALDHYLQLPSIRRQLSKAPLPIDIHTLQYLTLQQQLKH
jgi:hypothetical protein